ncbi:Protein DNA-DAMAGE INDUCIBLE 1, partial [Dictyocoela muelleri]
IIHKDNVMTLECIKSDKLDKYEIKVKGKFEYEALLDSGANSSFISKDVFDKERLILDGKPKTIKQAVGSFRTMGSAHWLVKNNSICNNFKFHVVDDLERDIIFGHDIIKLLKIDLNEHLYTFKSVENKYNNTEDNDLKLDIGDNSLIKYTEKVKETCNDFKDILAVKAN